MYFLLGNDIATDPLFYLKSGFLIDFWTIKCNFIWMQRIDLF